jgi:ABC-type transporter Mla subunit MlaD
MMKLSFATKVFAGLGSMVAVAIWFGTSLSYDVRELNYEISHIQEDAVNPALMALEVRQELYQRNTYLLRYLNTTDTIQHQAQEQEITESTKELLDLLSKFVEMKTEITEPFEEKFKESLSLIQQSEKEYGEILSLAKAGKIDAAKERTRTAREAVSRADKHMSEFVETARSEIVEDMGEAKALYEESKVVYAVGLAGTLLLSIGVALMVYFPTRRLKQMTEQLSSSSAQVSQAASQISSSSQSLASSASEQASSIEESSASLEEISGMVANNAKNAEGAAKLAQDMKNEVTQGVTSMQELQKSMTEILESNRRIEALVKVIEEIGEKTAIIDEIVFQTKLLSFNASVEAERAGEHGRGFAVVAQEVGNLAQMSGKAAAEISGIVKSSIKEAQTIAVDNKARVERGHELTLSTSEKLVSVQKNAETVTSSSEQIVTASKEQANGVKQISSAVDQLNKATQETAATSEESASAGEELSSQAQSLRDIVVRLETLLQGSVQQEADLPNQPEKKVVSFQARRPSAKPSKTQKSFNHEDHSLPKAAGDEWDRL